MILFKDFFYCKSRNISFSKQEVKGAIKCKQNNHFLLLHLHVYDKIRLKSDLSLKRVFKGLRHCTVWCQSGFISRS